MPTERSTKVWDPGSKISLHDILCSYNTLTKDLGVPFSEISIPGYSTKRVDIISYVYRISWHDVSDLSILFYNGSCRRFNQNENSLFTMIDEIERYDQESIQLTSLPQGNFLLEDFCIYHPEDKVTTLLRIFHLFSQGKKKSELRRLLATKLKTKSETDLQDIFNEYLYHRMTRNSTVTEKDLCMKEIHPYYDILLKFCYSEKLMKQEKYYQYKEFMVKHVDFVMSMIKELNTNFKIDCKTMSITCLFLKRAIDIDPSWHLTGQLWNQEYLTYLMSDLMKMMSKVNFYGTSEVYFKPVELNLSVRFQDLCISIERVNPKLKFKLILFYCEKLINQNYYQLCKEFLVHNLTLLIDLKKKVGGNDHDDSSYRKVSHDGYKPCDQMNSLWNKRHRIKNLTSLLSNLLCILPEDELYETISHYLFLIKNMKSDIVSKYLQSVKTDPYLNLLFKLFWCKKLNNEGHADGNIVYRCLNNFYKEKCEENKAEFTVQIISITNNLSEKSFTKVLLQCFLRRNLKTVNSMEIQIHCNKDMKESGQNDNFNSTPEKSKQDLIYTQCASILSGKKMKNVDIKHNLRKLNIKGPEDEHEVETQVKQLILFILLLLLTALGHKSAKLKKYLALKYEYDMASLYLLWCSGDIEVHPGPAWSRKKLEHISEQKRKWLQDINSNLLKLYWGIPTQSKPKNLWQKDNQPEQWPSDKPFYDTKNASKDDKGNKISDNEILTCLLECLNKKEVDIPEIYQSEISAWTNGNIQLLHKLQVYRIEKENVKSASLNLFLSNLGDDVTNLQNIKVSLQNPTLDKKQTEGLLNNDLRQKKQAELVAEINRDLANILCRLAKRINPFEKGDGTWNTPPPANWPEDVPFFNPKNRGKNKDKPKCPDTVLVCTFLKLPYLRIPKNLQQIVDAYNTMLNCSDTDGKKKNKEKLCRLYTIQSNLEKLDCAIQNMHKEGLFSRELHAVLEKWWKTQSIDEHAEHVLKSAMVRSDERPFITIDITKDFEQDTDLRYISYTIPIKDVYLHIKCKTGDSNQSNIEQTINRSSLTTSNNSENSEDSLLPQDVIDFVLEHDFVNQTECSYDNSVTDKRPKPFDLQGTPLPIRHQHLKPHNNLDTLTTHKTLSPDPNGSRCTTVYDTTSFKAFDSVHSSNSRNCENLDGNMSTSKRKQIEDDEEPVKKLLKTKVNQFGHYNRTDEEISSSESKNDGGSQEPNHISTINQHEIGSANVQDLPSLEFSLSDIIDGIGDNCNSKGSEDSESLQQICDLESINNSNQQDSHENINELNSIDNQMMDQTDDKTELEKCLKMIKYLSR